jgi:putative ABC transport system permease protein
VGAALLVRSLNNVLSSDRGFATDGRLTAEISLPRAYPPMKRTAIVKQILAGVKALPGMQSVATASGAMLVGGGTGMNFAAVGSSGEADKAPWATWHIVSPDYFKTIGLTMRAGRNFNESDKTGKPWRVIISERLARQIWPGENPVGKMCVLWAGQSNDQSEVVGVVSDMREHRLDGEPTLSVYFPTDDDQMSGTTLRLLMHTNGNLDAAGTELRSVVKAIDPMLPVSRVRSIETLVASSVSTRRFTMKLLGIFAGIAALLALAGVAGVLAYTMSHRKNEMGLRLALGARHGQLLTLAMRVGLAPVVFGLIAGLGIALWLSQLLTSLLYGVEASDPLTYAGVAAALLAAAAMACYLPARLVMNVDPASVMRID